jgi:hypothetical protein
LYHKLILCCEFLHGNARMQAKPQMHHNSKSDTAHRRLALLSSGLEPTTAHSQYSTLLATASFLRFVLQSSSPRLAKHG